MVAAETYAGDPVGIPKKKILKEFPKRILQESWEELLREFQKGLSEDLPKNAEKIIVQKKNSYTRT